MQKAKLVKIEVGLLELWEGQPNNIAKMPAAQTWGAGMACFNSPYDSPSRQTIVARLNGLYETQRATKPENVNAVRDQPQ